MNVNNGVNLAITGQAHIGDAMQEEKALLEEISNSIKKLDNV